MDRKLYSEPGFLGINVDENLTADYVWTELLNRSRAGDDTAIAKLLNVARHSEDPEIRNLAQKWESLVVPEKLVSSTVLNKYIEIDTSDKLYYGLPANGFLEGSYGIIGDDGKVDATLKYIEGYTGFSSIEEEQKGNYCVIHLKNADGVKKVEFQGTESKLEYRGFKPGLDDFIVFRVKSTESKLTIWYDEVEVAKADFSNATLQTGGDV